uniref:Uncharacterized protein n=1 Tax=Candidatus Kentrum sp. LFY TaxID=2126342 RepID=A0A450WH12_9GAMM|nr:MAG: hypothetical protein BECKLFY1418C_GA0070996_102212 [Candidatus Kentron sp. LFY]
MNPELVFKDCSAHYFRRSDESRKSGEDWDADHHMAFWLMDFAERLYGGLFFISHHPRVDIPYCANRIL